MNTKKISFIICVNDDTDYSECLFYIDRLRIPDGYEIDVYPVRDACSIYQGYNLAMLQTDAKYKIYMHQDVFLIYRNLLIELIAFFEHHPRAGMAGVLGCMQYPQDRRFYRAWDIGNVIGCSEKHAFWNDLSEKESQVMALDGMFLMTADDLLWREDVLSGWDFYDFSQSLEFRKKGYELWVPAQKNPWCIHDCGYLNLTGYDQGQAVFLQTYGEMLPDYSGQGPVYSENYRQRYQLMMELKEHWKILLMQHREEEITKMLEQAGDERFFDTETAVILNMLEIRKREAEKGIHWRQGFLADCETFEQAYQKYRKIKFYLRRIKYAPDDIEFCSDSSDAAKEVIRNHTML